MPCSNSTINPEYALKQTIYFPGRSLGKYDDEKEKLSFPSSFFELLFKNATAETGNGLEAATLVVKDVVSASCEQGEESCSIAELRTAGD